MLGAEFTNRFGETYNRLRVEQFEADEMIRWRLLAQHHKSDPLDKIDEWTGTEIFY